MTKMKWIKMEPLRCLHCSEVLDIGAVKDGRSCNAEKYDASLSPDWPYLIAMECHACGAVYPLLRSKTLTHISAIKTKNICLNLPNDTNNQ